jgi:hypothetical protein
MNSLRLGLVLWAVSVSMVREMDPAFSSEFDLPR